MPENGATEPYLSYSYAPKQHEIALRYVGYTGGNYEIWWGDATGFTNGTNGGTVLHQYHRAGYFMLRARTYDGIWLAEIQVVLPPVKGVHAEFGPDPDNRYLYAITPPDPEPILGTRLYRVNWRDGQPDPIQEQWGTPGFRFRRYLPPGKHTCSIYDLTTNQQFHWRDVQVEFAEDPDFTLDATGQDVELTVTANTGSGALVVDWGDGTLPAPVTGTTAAHTYSAGESTYLVQLYRADGSASTTHPVTVPGGHP